MTHKLTPEEMTILSPEKKQEIIQWAYNELNKRANSTYGVFDGDELWHSVLEEL